MKTCLRITYVSTCLIAVLSSLLTPAASNATTQNSFAGVSGLVSRFEPENLNPIADVWTDSANPSVSMSTSDSSISSTLQVNDATNLEGVWGSVGNFQVVSGTTQDFIRFPTALGTFDSYTIYYVARYSNVSDSSKRKRILSDSLGLANIAAGFHDGSIGKMYYIGDWFSPDPICYQGGNYICQASVSSQSIPASVTTVNDWVITGFRISGSTNDGVLRSNGMPVGFETSGTQYRSTHMYGINSGLFGVGTLTDESSDFELADYLVFDSPLTDGQMTAVESALAQRYGVPLDGESPSAPEITSHDMSASTLRASWGVPSNLGSGEIYGFQVRISVTGRTSDVYVNLGNTAISYDYVADRAVALENGAEYSVAIRALSTHGVSTWSTPWTQTYTAVPEGSIQNSEIQATTKQKQSLPLIPASLKRGKSLSFKLLATSGEKLVVSSSGACKTSKTTRTQNQRVLVKNKWKSKKVSIQIGWKVTMKKKGRCLVNFSAAGSANFESLAESKTVLVK